MKIQIQREEDRLANASYLEKGMFEFSKRRLKEIEDIVNKEFDEQKKIENKRVTKLRNISISSNIREV
jgi:hypothetical protein